MARIPVTWKRNLTKIPENILYSIGTVLPGNIRITAVKQIPDEEIRRGAYAHLGILFEGEKLCYPSAMSPLPNAGRWSKTNVEGRADKLRNLPKVLTTLTFESPHFGDWSKGSHTLTRQSWVYQRNYVPPRQLTIQIEAVPQPLDKQGAYLFKFGVEGALSPASPTFESDLLYALNILQENTGVAGVEAAEAGAETYEKSLTVEWETLGTGRRSLQTLTRSLPGMTEAERSYTEDRFELFSALRPQQFVLGSSGGNRYYGAVIGSDMLVFENMRYWNAIYIMSANWPEHRRLNRAEFLAKAQRDCLRIPHTGGWKDRVRAQVATLQAARQKGQAAAGRASLQS